MDLGRKMKLVYLGRTNSVPTRAERGGKHTSGKQDLENRMREGLGRDSASVSLQTTRQESQRVPWEVLTDKHLFLLQTSHVCLVLIPNSNRSQ